MPNQHATGPAAAGRGPAPVRAAVSNLADTDSSGAVVPAGTHRRPPLIDARDPALKSAAVGVGAGDARQRERP